MDDMKCQISSYVKHLEVTSVVGFCVCSVSRVRDIRQYELSLYAKHLEVTSIVVGFVCVALARIYLLVHKKIGVLMMFVCVCVRVSYFTKKVIWGNRHCIAASIVIDIPILLLKPEWTKR
jgi:hypothetical protein